MMSFFSVPETLGLFTPKQIFESFARLAVFQLNCKTASRALFLLLLWGTGEDYSTGQP